MDIIVICMIKVKDTSFPSDVNYEMIFINFTIYIILHVKLYKLIIEISCFNYINPN